MADRDLTLGVKVVGAPEAKAELDGLKQSTDGVVAAEAQVATATTAATEATSAQAVSAGTAAGALTGQATAAGALAQETRVVSIAVENARIATSEFVMALIQGGPGAEAAMKKAEVAVALLAEKIEIAKAAGAPLPRESTDQLESFTRNLSQGTEALNAQTAASGGTTAALRLQGVAQSGVTLALVEARASFIALASAGAVGSAEWTAAMGRVSIAVAGVNAQVALAQKSGGIVTAAQIAGAEVYTSRLASMGAVTATTAAEKRLFTSATAAAGQAIAGGTVNLGAMTAGFLRFLGPVGLAIAAITLLPTLVRSLSDAFKLLAGFIGDNMSKAVGEMAEGLGKAQERLGGLNTASRSYRDASDLLTASGLNVAKTFEAMAGSSFLVTDELAQMGEGFGQLTTPFDQARAAADRFYEQINRIRTVDPAFAQKLTEEFVRLARSVSGGTISADEFSDQLRTLQSRLAPLVKVSEDVGVAIKEKFGDKSEQAGVQFGALVATVASLDSRLNELKAGGLTTGQAFDVLKSEILKTAQESEKFVGIIPKLSPQMQTWFANIKDLAKGHDDVSVAIDKARAKTQESVDMHATFIGTLDGVITKVNELGEASGKAAAAFIPAADTIEAALDRIRAMAVQVDIATTNAFRTGGSSQLSTGTTGGADITVPISAIPTAKPS